MPFPPFGTGAGGGAGFTLGPPTNVFTGADRAAAESARDTYFTANPSNLTSYNNDTSLNIRLEYTASGNAVALFQVRNTAGDAWLDNSSAIGVAGPAGQDGQDGTATIPGVPDGTLLQATGGALAASSIKETTDTIEFDKSAMLPGGTISLEGFEISNPGGQLVLTDTASDIDYAVPSRSFTEANGTGTFSVDNLTPAADVAFQSRENETLTGSELGVNFTQTTSAMILQWTSSSTVTGSGDFYIVVHRGTSASDPVWYRSHTPAQVAAGDVFTLDGGNTVHDTRDHPVIFQANQPYFVRFIAVGGDFTVGGTTITQADIDGGSIFTTAGQQVPFYTVRFMTLTQDRVALFSELRTLEALQDAVATMFTGGTHNGITVTYDDTDGFINLSVTGTTPPITPGASVSAFSINIPATVNTNTDLNNARTVQFTTAGTTDIASLTLVVTTGTNQTISVPADDGTHSQAVTLAGIDASSAGTLTFQIRGTTTGGQTIMSNTQTVTIRAISADEQAYYGTRATNDFATVATSELTAVDVQSPGSTYTISGSWPATQFVGILEPTDRAISSIVETAFNQETLSTWTRTANARTIAGQTYDLLTLQNNGPSGTFEFRVTHA